MLWLFVFLSRPLTTFSLSAIRLLCFLIIHVSPGVALLISFKNFLAFTAWLTVRHKRPSFQPVLAFDVPSSLSSIVSSFWLKVRDTWLFLSLEHLEASVGLLISLISLLLCLREQGGLRGDLRKGRSVEQPEHSSLSYMGVFFGAQDNYNSSIKDRQSQTTITNTTVRTKFEILWELPK